MAAAELYLPDGDDSEGELDMADLVQVRVRNAGA